MSWVKLSDGFAEDPRLDEAGPLALALHVAALCYCSRQLTDGRLPRGAMRRLLDLDDPDTVAKALVDVGMWEAGDLGYQLVDYLVDQPSAEKVREQQHLKSERQQRWRERQRAQSKQPKARDAGVDASTPASQDASRDARGDAAPPRPAPKEAGRGAGSAPKRLARCAHNRPVAADGAACDKCCPHGLALAADGRLGLGCVPCIDEASSSLLARGVPA